MKKIALAAAALLAVTGGALAENPNVGGSDINVIAQEQLDNNHTSSVQHSAAYELLNPDADAVAAQDRVVDQRRDLFGNR